MRENVIISIPFTNFSTITTSSIITAKSRGRWYGGRGRSRSQPRSISRSRISFVPSCTAIIAAVAPGEENHGKSNKLKLLTHWGTNKNGHHFPDDIFKCLFLNENVWISIKISLNFVPKGSINNIPALDEIIAWPHWRQATIWTIDG